MCELLSINCCGIICLTWRWPSPLTILSPTVAALSSSRQSRMTFTISSSRITLLGSPIHVLNTRYAWRHHINSVSKRLNTHTHTHTHGSGQRILLGARNYLKMWTPSFSGAPMLHDSSGLSYLRVVHSPKLVAGDMKNKIKRKQVRPSSGTNVYPHIPMLRPHAARSHERRISSTTFTSAHLYGNVYIPWAWPVRWPIRPILGFWGSQVP